MRSLKVRKEVVDGELHFIIAESSEDFHEAEIRETTRKEASKPLLLLRAE